MPLFSSLAWSNPTGITLDGSMGAPATLTGPNFIITAGMGTQVGGNLFHSFGQFNLLNGETADFTATGSTGAINNIIARVTGGNASSIDGTIRSDIAGANLFLLNPSGVMFGPNAQVNISGAFTVGTPDYVKMADGIGRFNTSLGGNDTLTSAAISSFGFLSNTPQPVQFSQSNLTFATASNFTVISGDITLDGATLTAPGGNVSLFSAGSSGEVAVDPVTPSAHFNTSTVSSFGDVTLKNNAKVAINSAQGGGSLVIRGGKIVMQNTSTLTSVNSGANAGGSIGVTGDSVSLTTGSTITTQTTAGGAGGAISVTSGGPVTLQSGGQILTSTQATGAAGDIHAQAQSLAIDGSAGAGDNSGIFSQSATGATGTGGDINLTLSSTLSLTDQGTIAANAFGFGPGGTVSIQAQSVSIDGTGAPGLSTGISSDSEPSATGQGGDIDLTVIDGLIILGAGFLGADTFSSGNAGNVNVQAASMTINGSGAIGHFTGISSSSNKGATGQGGSVTATATGSLLIQGGGAIVSDTFSPGKAGEVNVQAGSLTIDGEAAPSYFTGIASDSNTGASAEGGVVTVSVTNNILIEGAGAIAADTHSSGEAGEITVNAASMTLDGSSAIGSFTGITSASDTDATGHGGNINVNVAGGISIVGAGAIEADTFSSAAAGKISVQAGSMLIDGSFDPDALTGISSNADVSSTNNGGDVTVTITNDLTCTGAGGIDAQAFSTGNGGLVSVTVGGTIRLSNAGYIDSDTYASGNGGTVTVTAPSILIDGSGSAGMGFPTGINSDSSSYFTANATGNGGSVTVNAAQSLSITNGGSISALTETLGNGGSVVLNVPGNLSLSNEAQITAASSNSSPKAGTAGGISIHAGNMELNEGSSLAASAVAANAGSIELTATQDLTLLDGSSITTSAGIDGGSINLKVGGVVYLLNSSIKSEANGGGGTSGGNITIDPQFVVLNDSLISANDLLGTGGNILIITDDFLNNNSLITATGSTDGTITISAPDLDLSGSLLALPGDLVHAERQLRERCANSVNHEFSTLTVVGRGGIEPAPEELQSDFGASAALRQSSFSGKSSP